MLDYSFEHPSQSPQSANRNQESTNRTEPGQAQGLSLNITAKGQQWGRGRHQCDPRTLKLCFTDNVSTCNFSNQG